MTNGALWYCLDDVGAPSELDLGATHTAKLVADRRSLCAPGHAEFDENVLGVGVLDAIDNDANAAAISHCQPSNVASEPVTGGRPMARSPFV